VKATVADSDLQVYSKCILDLQPVSAALAAQVTCTVCSHRDYLSYLNSSSGLTAAHALPLCSIPQLHKVSGVLLHRHAVVASAPAHAVATHSTRVEHKRIYVEAVLILPCLVLPP
jgi:hypothetical protein